MTEIRQKILLASDGNIADIYAGALAEGFLALGQQVGQFTWKEFFHNYPYADRYPTDRRPGWGALKSAYYRAQNKYLRGPAVHALNRALIRRCRQDRPDLLFIYRGTHIYPGTLRELKRELPGLKIFGYNNDDPFSTLYPAYVWRFFLQGLAGYDHLFAYREKNLADYRARQVHNVSLLRSYYRAAQNYPLAPKPAAAPYACDVVFVGHYEPDGRDASLLRLLDAGIDTKIFGLGWEASPLYGKLCQRLGAKIASAYGPAYNLALNSARIALVFLSKLNHDTYTRRCFEIPAAGTLMLAEYTDDLATNLFAEDAEAVYFRSADELVAKAQTLLADPARCDRIAKAGRARLLRDGHEVTDRARQILATLATEQP